jgi:hypothetical protein
LRGGENAVHGATREIIRDLRELSDNLLALQQEWYRLEEGTRPRGRSAALLKKLAED